MGAILLAVLALLSLSAAVWAFCARRNHFLILFGSAATLAAALSMWLLLGTLEERGMAIPRWLLERPAILVGYACAYVAGMAAIGVGCFRLPRDR